ncbi:SAM-dependent methyltransferase [Nocardia shimofusensis]|uniref:SAM-dependent methyltransferase n=1 Tax=Nocardia shimofusensis TaxID=228596 RepID=UPI00082F9B19
MVGDARFRWIVEVMDMRPADLVLEIGPGSGTSLEYLARELPRGRVLAVDRSATAIDRAARRNARHLDSGRITLWQKDFGRLDPDRVRADFDAPAGFDKILAVNVNAFWTKKRPTAELTVVRELLAPDGALFLCYGYDAASSGPKPEASELTRRLAESGFATTVTTHGDLLAVRAVRA